MGLEEMGCTYLALVKSKDKRKFVRETSVALNRIMENIEGDMRFILPDGVAGHTAKRILEYQLRNKGHEAEFFMEPGKDGKKKKREKSLPAPI